MRKAVVTGGGGFIGRSLVRVLASRFHEVVALDNNQRGSLDSVDDAGGKVSRVECDVLNLSDVTDLLRDVDHVYHLASVNGTENFYKDPARVLEVAILGTHNVLRACIENAVGSICITSTSEVYNFPSVIPTPETVECRIPDMSNPRFSYAGGKIAAELMTINYLRDTGIKYTIVRPHNVYGPNMGFEHVIPNIVQKLFLAKRNNGSGPLRIDIQGSGKETRAFIFVDDAVRAIALCSLPEHPTGIYHIGTENEISVVELVQQIGIALGVDVDVRGGMLTEGSPLRRCPDTQKLRSLGFEPATSMLEGLRQTVTWYWRYYSSGH